MTIQELQVLAISDIMFSLYNIFCVDIFPCIILRNYLDYTL